MTTHISFRLKHPSEDLTKLAVGLELSISRMWTVGHARKTPLGDPLDGIYQESYLAFKIVSTKQTIAGAVELVRQALELAIKTFPILRDPALKKTLLCTLESEGEVLDLPTLKVLVELGIEIELNGCT